MPMSIDKNVNGRTMKRMAGWMDETIVDGKNE